jgi:GTPase SAR1 family protein
MIADSYLQLRSRLETAIGGLLKLASDMMRESAVLDTIQGMLTDIREPLLFVVVGEVKAGKSSLLNALFGHDFAKVDVLPATDRVYIFKYGAQEQSVEISPQLAERYLPIDFLRDFNVVDTPGTNTMVAEHQTITENFVPRADLVLFVFSVVNPWSASAWEFLSFVQKKWLKNVVFVLQQSDLREAREVEIVRQHLQETALQKLGFSPPIFAVSARKALLAKTSGVDKERLWAESEFARLEQHINQVVAGPGARILKLSSSSQTACLMLGDIAEQIRGCFRVIFRDEEQLGRVRTILHSRKEQTLRQVGGFLRGVEQACRACEEEGAKLLDQRLSFWRTWKLVFSKAEWQHEFQADLETKLRNSVEPQVENAVQLLETDLRGLWPQLQEMIEVHFAAESKTHVSKTIPDFARQRRELLQSVELALVERTAGKGMEEELGRLFRETANWLRLPAGVAAAGGIVAIIAAMSSAAVADVTGILAGSALVIGTMVVYSRRRKILQEYRLQMELKRLEVTQAIEQHLQHAMEVFYAQIASAFKPLEAFCSAERQRYEPLLKRVEALEHELGAVTTEIRNVQ